MLINPEEIKKSLSVYGWEYSNKKISKSFSFKTYKKGIDFVNVVADLAETKNHHPEILVEWCKITIEIASHDLGGVTTKCVNLAMDIELNTN